MQVKQLITEHFDNLTNEVLSKDIGDIEKSYHKKSILLRNAKVKVTQQHADYFMRNLVAVIYTATAYKVPRIIMKWRRGEYGIK